MNNIELQVKHSGTVDRTRVAEGGRGTLLAIEEKQLPFVIRRVYTISGVSDAGALRGRVQGTLNLLAVSADLDYTLTASAMTPRPGLSWQNVDLQGRWHGTASAPNADGHLLIKRLLIPGGTELADLDANLTATGGMLTTHATLTGLVIPGSQPKLFQDSPFATIHWPAQP